MDIDDLMYYCTCCKCLIMYLDTLNVNYDASVQAQCEKRNREKINKNCKCF